MSEFKLPHVEDLATNSKLPGQLTENFKVIEQEDTDLRKLINDKIEQEDTDLRKLINDKHDDLSKQLTQLNQRLDELMNGGAM